MNQPQQESFDEMRARLKNEEQAKKDKIAAALAKFDAQNAQRKAAAERAENTARAAREAEITARQVEAATKADARLKEETRHAFIKQGGNPLEFETHFAAIREELIRARTIEQLQQDQAAFKKMIRGM